MPPCATCGRRSPRSCSRMRSESRIPASSSTISTFGGASVDHVRSPSSCRRSRLNGSRGRMTRGSTREPRPVRRCRRRRSPRCASIARCTTASPSPLPPGFVVKNGSNSRSRISAGCRRPSSVTRTAHASAGRTRRRRSVLGRPSARASTRTSPPARRRLHRVQREVEDGAMQQVLVAVDDQRVARRRRTRRARHRGRSGCALASVAAPRTSAREIDRLRRAPRARARSRGTRRAVATDDPTRARSARRASARRRRVRGDRASCSTALRMDASGFLISCASDALSSATPSSRSARRRSASRRFWSEMSWKIAVAVRSVRSPSPSVYVVVTPTGKSPVAVVIVAFAAVVRMFGSAPRARARGASSGATLARSLDDSAARHASIEARCRGAAPPSGWRRAGTPSDVDRDDPAADVAEDVGRLESHAARSSATSSAFPSPCPAKLRGEVAAPERDGREDARAAARRRRRSACRPAPAGRRRRTGRMPSAAISRPPAERQQERRSGDDEDVERGELRRSPRPSRARRP